MFYLVKVLVSALLIVLISEVSKKFPTLGGLIASLPLLSVLGMIWLYADTRDPDLLGQHALSTFWFVLPSLPMFLLLPWLLKLKWQFGWAMLAACLLTIGLYLAMVKLLAFWQISL